MLIAACCGSSHRAYVQVQLTMWTSTIEVWYYLVLVTSRFCSIQTIGDPKSFWTLVIISWSPWTVWTSKSFLGVIVIDYWWFKRPQTSSPPTNSKTLCPFNRPNSCPVNLILDGGEVYKNKLSGGPSFVLFSNRYREHMYRVNSPFDT